MLHDPLYDWSVGPSKVAARQAGEWEQLKQHEAGQGNRKRFRFLTKNISTIGIENRYSKVL